MKKILAVFLIAICMQSYMHGQTYAGWIDTTRIPVLHAHYQPELTFDTIVDPLRWSEQTPGLHASFATTDKLYFRREVPDITTETQTWNMTGWKGERLNFQILIWSPDTLQQVNIRIKEVVNEQGNKLPDSCFSLNLIRYVLSNYPYGADSTNCGTSPYAYLMPDRFEPFSQFDLPGKTVRPVWLTANIPSNAQAGIYQGIAEIKSGNYKSSLNFKINVQNHVLPKPQDWKFRLDIWQNPWVIARYYNLKPWSDEHKLLLKKHLKLYADAGGTFITTYAVHSPWADVTYRVDEAMVEWIKGSNGKWKFDYGIFDQYVELCMEAGISRAITVYTPIPWGNRFRYWDEKKEDYTYETWRPESDTFKVFWNIFLTDLRKHLEKKEWFNKTYLGVNENPMEQTLTVLKFIRQHSPDWKITYAGDWHPQLDSLLHDYCSIYGKEPDVKTVKNRSSRGFTSTYYVCCTPPKPNNFVFSPPAEGRWMGWYTYAHGYDGFLRWAYDSWTADPARDARHLFWPAGDCFLVYPGANSSIRFEKLREGIVDYEKIRILKELASKSKDKNIGKQVKEFDVFLDSFNQEKKFDEQNIINTLAKGREMMQKLSDNLK